MQAYIPTMTNTTETETLTDADGNCICKLDGCTTCKPSCELCDGQHVMNECPSHACTGDNCYCIGGDENFDALWDDSIMESLRA